MCPAIAILAWHWHQAKSYLQVWRVCLNGVQNILLCQTYGGGIQQHLLHSPRPLGSDQSSYTHLWTLLHRRNTDQFSSVQILIVPQEKIKYFLFYVLLIRNIINMQTGEVLISAKFSVQVNQLTPEYTVFPNLIHLSMRCWFSGCFFPRAQLIWNFWDWYWHRF